MMEVKAIAGSLLLFGPWFLIVSPLSLLMAFFYWPAGLTVVGLLIRDRTSEEPFSFWPYGISIAAFTILFSFLTIHALGALRGGGLAVLVGGATLHSAWLLRDVLVVRQ